MALDTIAAGRAWIYSHNIGRRLEAGTGFSNPVGVAIAKDDVLFVANRTVPRILKLTMDEEFIHEFGRLGRGDGEFIYLTALALDQDENVYAADEWLNRITVFDKDGNFLTTWGVAGEDEGQLNGPSGMVFDADDNLWIVNSLNSRIQKFSKDGKYINGFGTSGNAEGQLDMPWGIAIDSKGDIYLADWNNHRVQKFNPEGSHLLTFGSGRITGVAPSGRTPYANALIEDIGVIPNDLNHPSGVAVDGDGDVYVADWMNERVVIFDAAAKPLATLRGDARELSRWAQRHMDSSPALRRRRRLAKRPEVQAYFRMPSYCAFDRATNRLIVCDTLRFRLQVYEKDTSYEDPQINL